ncbi:hypothetical protein BGX27_007986 [Mortierella sp. AM989]|nr:hypothetical protein BGX27_007986 [Mortierella sp. AM989]
MAIFWIARIFFLGTMFSLIPVPHWQGMSSSPLENHQFIPELAITISQYISFSLVALLLVMPTVISIQQLASSPRDVKERIEAVRSTSTFPRVLIVMPVYNELPEVLHAAICSAIDGDYPKEHLHIFISFDNDATSELYRALIRNLGVPADGEYYPPVLDLYFRGVQITVSRFPHGGKRLTQKKTFGLINSIYKEYPDKTDHLFVLFIDSDIILPASTIANFVWDMELKPNSKNLLAMTGVITVTTKEDITFLNLLQDIEYVHGQFIGRAIESAVGGCVTLPGALTIFRYSAFLESYDEYFADRSVSDLWDFGRSHLGEDRYLTHLLMTKAVQPKLIQFCHRATCKTEPVREWRNLMKQRRRWFLGFLTNEGALLSDPHLWWKYPWLLSFRLIQDIVTGTSMVSFITVAAVASGMQNWSPIWLGLLVAYFCLNWGLMLVYGVWLGRYKAMFYPLMFFVGPFVSWFLLVYGVITANERTWGGPRADAAAKKEGDDDVEKGNANGDADDNPQGPDFGPDEERIELPDHLFYPNQQELVNDDLEVVVTEQPQTAERTSYTGKAVLREDGDKAEIQEDGDKAELYWDEDDDTHTKRDSGDYFGSQPFGFLPHPLLKEDTEWWDDDNHLSNLGIMPYIHQPKIPAMFASAETLILTPVMSHASLVDVNELRSSKSTARSSHGSLYTPRHSGTAPGTPNLRSMPGTPKILPSSASGSLVRSPTPNGLNRPNTPNGLNRPNTPSTPKMMGSRRGSVTNSLVMPSPALPGSIPISIPLPPGMSPSPRPAFRYIPVEYLTPTHSTPTTPKMSPVILPSAHTGLIPPPAIHSSTPPLPSPSSTTGRVVHASSKVPADIIAAALAITSVSSKSKRISSHSKASSEGSTNPIPEVKYLPPPPVAQKTVPAPHLPSPPLDPSAPTAAASTEALPPPVPVDEAATR